MVLVLGGVKLGHGGIRGPLVLGTLAQRVVGVRVVPVAAVAAGEVGQARRRIAAEILVDGVVHRQRHRHGEQALPRMPGEARARTRADGEPSKDGQVQTRKPMDGTCDYK